MAYGVRMSVVHRDRTKLLLRRPAALVRQRADGALASAAPAARTSLYVPANALYKQTACAQAGESPAFAVIAGAFGKGMDNWHMVDAPSGSSTTEAERISEGMKAAADCECVKDLVNDAVKRYTASPLAITNGTVVDHNISRGPDIGGLTSVYIYFQTSVTVDGAAHVNAWHGVWYHPMYALNNISASDLATNAAVDAHITLGHAVRNPEDYLTQAHKYCAVAVQLHSSAPSIIWHAHKIGGLGSTGQVSFGAGTGLRYLAVLHTAAPGFEMIHGFRQVEPARRTTVRDRKLICYDQQTIHDAEVLIALNTSKDFDEVVMFEGDGNEVLTGEHVGTLDTLLLINSAAAMAANYPKVLEEAGFSADDVDLARQRLQDGPRKGLFEHWHLAPGLLVPGSLEETFTTTRFFATMKKKVLARTSELAAPGAGADTGGAAGSSTSGTAIDSPAKRVKTGTSAAAAAGKGPPAGAAAAQPAAAPPPGPAAAAPAAAGRGPTRPKGIKTWMGELTTEDRLASNGTVPRSDR